jgi:hypothetical protein
MGFIVMEKIKEIMNCKHNWDKKGICEKCGVNRTFSFDSNPFAPASAGMAAPMSINLDKEMVEREFTKHLTEDLTKHLYN